jgi:hypothetical protein
MDTATAEYLFCCDFFQEDNIFSELFSTTLAVVEGSLAASIQVPLVDLTSFVSRVLHGFQEPGIMHFQTLGRQLQGCRQYP